MPGYSISLNMQLNQIATKAASETGLDVQTYLNKIIKEHLVKIQSQEKLV